MVVYASTQFLEYTHSVIARCLGVPEHNICVITRRASVARRTMDVIACIVETLGPMFARLQNVSLESKIVSLYNDVPFTLDK
ncbi:hypothetical protein KY285_008511 [Solanum tuberosum]|nr:hypothetical protein KY285_008511 [Solanum tuberosum]